MLTSVYLFNTHAVVHVIGYTVYTVHEYE